MVLPICFLVNQQKSQKKVQAPAPVVVTGGRGKKIRVSKIKVLKIRKVRVSSIRVSRTRNILDEIKKC